MLKIINGEIVNFKDGIEIEPVLSLPISEISSNKIYFLPDFSMNYYDGSWHKIGKDSFISQRVSINTIPNTIGQTTFSLPFTYENINEVQFDLDGIPLNLGTDFTEDSNTPHSSIILTSAIDSLTENSIIYIRRIIGVNNILLIIDNSVPSDNSVYSSNKIENIVNTCGTF